MPIRMSEDNDSNGGYSGNQGSGNSGGGSRGGGGFPGGNLIGFLLPLLFRYPKLLIVVIVIGGGYYLVNKGCSGTSNKVQQSTYAKGATLDQEVKTTYFGYLCCGFAIVGAYFAIVFIKKDIDLIKSADRIR